MKINKLLFFLLALISFNSCVEYVDNGTKPEGPEQPEEQKFTAEHSNPEEAKYVGDKFEFTAMLNSVDVTSSTVFKVNGTTITGNSYTAVKVGSNSVIATMDNYTATFKFTVLEEDEEEPEPTGNRIEYGGKSYPVSETMWGLILDGADLYTMPINGVDHAVWYMDSSEVDGANKVVNQFVTIIATPTNSQGQAVLPFFDSSLIVHVGGGLTIDGLPVFEESKDVVYTFAQTGNTAPNAQNIGTADYTGVMTDDATNKTAKLFWKGNYMFFTPDISEFSKGKSTKKNIDIRNIKKLNYSKVLKVNLAK